MERNNRPRRAMGGPHGMGAGERAKDFSGTMRRLLREMGRWRLSLIAVAVLGVGPVGLMAVRAAVLQGAGNVFHGFGLVLFIACRTGVAGFCQIADVFFQFSFQPWPHGGGGRCSVSGRGAVGDDAARGNGEDERGG